MPMSQAQSVTATFNAPHVHQLVYSSSQNQWFDQDLSASIGGPLAKLGTGVSAFPINGDQVIYYLADNQHVHRLAYSTSTNQWSDQDGTALTGGPIAASRGGISGFAIGAEHEYYIAGDQHVHQLIYYPSVNQWFDQDLSALTGGTLAALGSKVSAFPVNGDQNAYYLASDQHVHLLMYSATSNQWSDQDATAITGGPGAVSGGGISGFAIGSDHHIYYLGGDQHVHQLLYSTSANQWFDQDLTSMTSGPLGASGSGVSGFAIGNDQHVYYLATDQHMHQMVYSASANQWFDQDLTSMTSGSLGALGSGVSGFAISGDQHVYYLATDQHMHQMVYSASANQWFDQDFTSTTSGPLGASGSGVSGFAIGNDQHVYYLAP